MLDGTRCWSRARGDGRRRAAGDGHLPGQNGKLAFLSGSASADSGDLWVMEADGSGRRVLARRGEILWAELSPDGRRVVFARRHLGRRYGLYTVGVDRRGARRIAFFRAILRAGVS
jgi:hypothetical protein